MARGVVADDPANVAANLVLVADRIQAGDEQAALGLLDIAQSHAPDDEGLTLARIGLLERIGDNAALGAALAAAAAKFPENIGLHRGLIRWHIQEGDLDAAEAMLRADAAAAATTPARADPGSRPRPRRSSRSCSSSPSSAAPRRRGPSSRR